VFQMLPDDPFVLLYSSPCHVAAGFRNDPGADRYLPPRASPARDWHVQRRQPSGADLSGDGYGEAQRNRNCHRMDNAISPVLSQINKNFAADRYTADHYHYALIDPAPGVTVPSCMHCG
ncbi:MAG: hypothetical protein IKP86_09795, partial [Anaerolineaceae bacterium]|nr:hypothetical protein [Anaerolineaceae bacterium]